MCSIKFTVARHSWTTKTINTMFRFENCLPASSEQHFVSQTQDSAIECEDSAIECDVFHPNDSNKCLISQTQNSRIVFGEEEKSYSDNVLVRSHWRRLPKSKNKPSKRERVAKKTPSRPKLKKTPSKQASVAKMDIASHKEIRRIRQMEDKELKAKHSSERNVASVNEWKSFWSTSNRKNLNK